MSVGSQVHRPPGPDPVRGQEQGESRWRSAGKHQAAAAGLGHRSCDGQTDSLSITARPSPVEQFSGLHGDPTLLLARLRAHLRRRPDTTTDTEPIRVADLVVDIAARRCLVRDREIDLRPKEFELLVALARHPGIALTREDLMAQVWDENWFGSTKTLDVTMAALPGGFPNQFHPPNGPGSLELPKITTLRGHGYRLERPSPT